MYYTKYAGADLGAMAIDIVGGLMNALARQAGTIGVILVALLVVVVVVDLLTGVFGIFKYFKG
jgi:hypothetical protein